MLHEFLRSLFVLNGLEDLRSPDTCRYAPNAAKEALFDVTRIVVGCHPIDAIRDGERTERQYSAAGRRLRS